MKYVSARLKMIKKSLPIRLHLVSDKQTTALVPVYFYDAFPTVMHRTVLQYIFVSVPKSLVLVCYYFFLKKASISTQFSFNSFLLQHFLLF